VTETKGDTICSICRRSKNSGTAGSMTQWIASCQCDLPTAAPAQEAAFPVCGICRMRIKEQRPGSITQWIFSENFCKCENPVVAEGVIPLEISIPGATADDVVDDEVALEIDANDFPLERYRPLKLIGRGALGEVYLCRDLLLKNKVAVKCLLNLTPDSIVSFQTEAKIASKLKHPAVIGVKDFGTTNGGRPFMVMEFFPGKSLAELLAEHRSLSERDVLRISTLVCSALEYLHQNDVFHRDLKPSNILVHVDEKEQIQTRLIDFGLSKTTQDVQSKTLADGKTIVGTPGYMSPDQISGQSYDARSEIYSVGCIMYEALTGIQPFQADNPLQLLNKHVTEDVPPLSEHAPGVSSELCEIVETCLSKSKESRYQTCSQLFDLLENVKPNRSGQAANLAAGEFEPTVSPKSKRSSAKFVSIGLAVVLAIAVIAYAAFNVFRETPVVSHISEFVPSTMVTLDEKNDDSFKQIAKRQTAKHTIEDSRLSMEAVESFDTTSTKMMVLSKVAPTNDLLMYVSQGRVIPELYLTGCTLTERDAELLLKVKPDKLDLTESTGVSDKFLATLAKLERLEWLCMTNVKNLTPKSMEQIASMPGLRRAGLCDTKLTNAHLKELSKSKSLQVYNLAGNSKFTLSGLTVLGNKPYTVRVNVDPIFRQQAYARLKEFEAANLQLTFDEPNRIAPLGGLYKEAGEAWTYK